MQCMLGLWNKQNMQNNMQNMQNMPMGQMANPVPLTALGGSKMLQTGCVVEILAGSRLHIHGQHAEWLCRWTFPQRLDGRLPTIAGIPRHATSGLSGTGRPFSALLFLRCGRVDSKLQVVEFLG